MYKGSRVLAIIPARGGSKGLPRKNIATLIDKPLIAWTIEAAHGSCYIDRVILSSDDDEIIDCAKAYGCDVPFKRSGAIATDSATSIEVVIDALSRIPGYDYVVLLQPTSPLRTAGDIDQAIENCVNIQASSCVSISPVQESPYWMYTLDNNGRLKQLVSGVYPQRQLLPPVYALNGAIYVIKCETFVCAPAFIYSDTVAHVMPYERSVDIDTQDDLDAIRFRLGRGN